MQPTLIIDADDTLWETEIYYDRSIAAFTELMTTQGFERQEARHVVDAVERERVPVVGYGPQDFVDNLVIAYERLCARHNLPVEADVSDAARDVGQAVMLHPITLLDGVADTLAGLKRFCRLLLLTKGDMEAQLGKVARSGLGHLFDGLHVVPEKDASVIRGLVARYGLQPDQTWMVGNSPRSDINPALEAGIGAVYIPHANTWELEQAEIAQPERAITLRRFTALATLFSEAGQGGGS